MTDVTLCSQEGCVSVGDCGGSLHRSILGDTCTAPTSRVKTSAPPTSAPPTSATPTPSVHRWTDRHGYMCAFYSLSAVRDALYNETLSRVGVLSARRRVCRPNLANDGRRHSRSAAHEHRTEADLNGDAYMCRARFGTTENSSGCALSQAWRCDALVQLQGCQTVYTSRTTRTATDGYALP